MAFSYKSNKLVPDEKCHVVDLRTDTLTQQSAEMKKFMMEAEVGDDVFEEDPTAIVLVHCDKRGSEVLLGNLSHIHIWEQGNISQLGGVYAHTLNTLPDGTFDLDELKDAVRPDNIHLPTTKLVCIENTYNQLGGKVVPLEWLEKLGDCCRELGLPIHMDAARLMNAAVALQIPPARVVRDCTTVSMCLSKGLGAPVGSVIAGPKDFIERARRLRKALGGGVRQPGMLAAAGIYGLDHAPKLMEKDHAHAKAIAKGVADFRSPLIQVDPDDVQTNIVVLKCDMKVVFPNQLCNRMQMVTEEEAASIGHKIILKCFSMAKTSVRLVLYFNISSEDVHLAIKKLQFIIKEYERRRDTA